MLRSPDSITGAYFSGRGNDRHDRPGAGRWSGRPPPARRAGSVSTGATKHNVANLDLATSASPVRLPVRRFGLGQIDPARQRDPSGPPAQESPADRGSGGDRGDRAGARRSPRSCSSTNRRSRARRGRTPPSTVEAWELIRELYAATPGGAGGRLHRLQLFVQQRRGPVRPLPGPGLRARRDAVPFRCVRPLPDLRGAALQARGAGHRVERPVRRRPARRRACPDALLLFARSAGDPPAAGDARRGRAWAI